MRKGWLSLLLFFFILIGYSQCINSFPYNEDFEANNGNWIAGGTGSDWAWGIPSKPIISQAYIGSNCWMVGGLATSFYNNGERSFIQSSCFDFTNLQNPHVTFAIYWETENVFDGVTFQSSIDAGVSWQNVGSANDASDCLNQYWFNSQSINNLTGLSATRQGWSGTILNTQGNCQGGNGSGSWRLAKHCMADLAGEPDVRFRFAFGAGTSCNNYDGIAIDNITIGESPSGGTDFTYNCTGNSIAFTAISALCPTTYQWNFGDGNFATGLAVSHSYATTQAQTVTLTTSGNCQVTETVVKQVQSLAVNAAAIPVTCFTNADGKAYVNATGASAYSYTWNTTPQQTTDTAFNLRAGVYTVTVGAANFCDAIVNVTVTEPSAFSITSNLSPDTCDRGVGKIEVLIDGGTSPYNYLWSTGDTTATIYNLIAGNYTFMALDAYNCGAGTVYFLPSISGINILIDATNVTCYDTRNGKIETSVAGGNMPYQYVWSNNANAANLVGLDTGKYVLQLTDATGCVQLDSILIEKEYCQSYIYFPTAFSPNGDGVNDFFRPKYSQDLKTYFVRVYNRWGELVYESSDINEGWNGVYKNVNQPLSTYAWYAEFSFTGGKKNVQSGNLTLMR